MEFVVENFEVLSTDAAHIQELKNLVLNLAMRGQLVEQDSSDESASTLIKRIKAEKSRLIEDGQIRKEKKLSSVTKDEIPFNLPEGWIWCRLGELAHSMMNGIYKPAKYYSNDGIGCFRMYNIKGGEINFFNIKRMILTKKELETYELKPGDILVNRVNSRELVGKSAIIPKLQEPFIFESKNIRLRLMEEEALPQFVNLFLATEGVRDIFEGDAKQTTGQATISQPQIAKLAFPLPPLPEQRRIVQKVNHLFRQIDALAAGAEQAEGVRRRLRAALLHRLEQAPGRAAASQAWAQLEEQFGLAIRRVEDVQALRQSILQLAVKGLLVEQNADLPAPQADKYWVYVIKCSNGSNYIGQTGNLRKRWREHLKGEGADWTKRYPPQYLMYWEAFDSREEAINKEKWLKTGFGRKWIKREEAANRLWRAGEPASVLLERIKEEKARLVEEGKIRKQKALPAISEEEKPFEAPEGWVWCRLGELASLITKGSSPKWQGIKYVEKEEGILFVTSKNVGNYSLLLENSQYVENKFNKIEPRSILQEGDILMNIVGASIGRTALYDLEEIANINQAVCLIRLFPVLNKFYLLHFFNSPICISYMFDKQVDNARANLSMGNISKFLIPLPPLAEQRRIVERVEELLGWCDRLEAAMGEMEEKEGRLVRAAVR